mmetsp:Transcript_58746/g.110038  ORF Transcript_58746/g.110038 Transcript_58746/m.110038 type:complete len:85 (+) Transcript_58746:245-499(+)
MPPQTGNLRSVQGLLDEGGCTIRSARSNCSTEMSKVVQIIITIHFEAKIASCCMSGTRFPAIWGEVIPNTPDFVFPLIDFAAMR